MRIPIIIALLISLGAHAQLGQPTTTLEFRPSIWVIKIDTAKTTKIFCNHKFVKVENDTVTQLSPYSWSSVAPELICVFCHKIKRQTIQVDEIEKYPYIQMLRIDSLYVHPAFWYVDHSKITNESYSYDQWLPSEYKPAIKPNRFRKDAKEAARETNKQLKLKNK